MTFERTPGLGPEPVPNPPPTDDTTPAVEAAGTGDSAGRHATPVQIRLQILTTEHWSLLASRSLAWNESFSRAGMFLSTLSGSIVALSLIGGVDGFHDAFFVIALVVLPVVLFVGIGTWLRMGATNYHDAVTIIVMGVHDDAPGVGITMAVPPGTAPIVHLVAGTPTLVMVLNGVLTGAIAALALIYLTPVGDTIVLAVGLAAAIVVYGIQVRSARSKISRAQR